VPPRPSPSALSPPTAPLRRSPVPRRSLRSPSRSRSAATTGRSRTRGVAEAAGIDLVDAKVLPLPDGSGLRFIWEVSNLPAQVPPEGVRYNWSFTAGGAQFQLQAKRTNLASVTTTEDPVGYVQQVSKGDFFQLRGACQTSYQGTPAAGCYHLAFLKGAFDVANKQVSIDVPYQTRDSIGRLSPPS
jgi:hypothetical protein